jgi:hypothetical protein
MTDSLALIGEIDPFTESDKLDAEAVLFDMQNTVESIRRGEIKLAMSWVHLGSLLLKAQTRKHWITWGYDSFGKLIDDLRGKLDRQRSYLYNVVDVSERLLPSVSEDDLEKIGISKANQLARYCKQSGLPVPKDLLDVAFNENTSVEDLHVAVLEALNEKCDPKGSWFNFEGFYLLPDERYELNQAIELAKRVDPPIPATLPDHEQRKYVMLKFAREFYGTWVGQEVG